MAAKRPGTNPIQAISSRADLIFVESGTDAASAPAVIGPMPGVLARHERAWFDRCQVWMRRSAALISHAGDTGRWV